jgi:hypothetical protein
VADMSGSVGPCDWPTLACPDMYGLETEDEATEVEQEAAFILWSFTGQRYGLCTVAVTPPPVCSCDWRCTCRGCALTLPAPVYEVDEVLVDGGVSSDWVQRGNQILRSTPWPQDVEVTYKRGIPVPAGGARVVSELARELALYRCKDSRCRLPSNITSRTRQGDSIQFGQRPMREKETPLTGIPMIDMWVRAADGANPPGRVWSPDVDGWVSEQVITSV